jgi:hypothetical protein
MNVNEMYVHVILYSLFTSLITVIALFVKFCKCEMGEGKTFFICMTQGEM